VANYFLDNQDIQFLFKHIDVEEIAALQERYAENGDADFAPEDPKDSVDNYWRTLEIVGDVSARVIA
jgi:hypothetical protein